MKEDIRQVVRRIKTGDKTAFRWLVENYQQAAFSLAFKILGDEEEARDTLQESFIKIWKKISLFSDESNFISWMFKITSNTAIDKLRAQKKNNWVSIDKYSKNKITPDFFDLDKEMDNKELGELIKTIASGLPEKQRLIFVMRDLEGFSAKITGEILQLSETTVKSNLYHARMHIRNKLTELK